MTIQATFPEAIFSAIGFVEMLSFGDKSIKFSNLWASGKMSLIKIKPPEQLHKTANKHLKLKR